MPTTSLDLADTVATPRAYISWPAVFAGNAVTGGLLLTLFPLGAAAGLAMASPYRDSGSSAGTIGWVAVLWLAFTYLFSVSAGGYLAGRLRPRVGDAATDEVHFRDMVNGLVFWGVGMIVSALFTFLTLTSTISTATSALGNAVGPAASQAAAGLPSTPTDYVADLFLRGTATGQETPARADADVRAEITRILAASANTGEVSDADRQYLASLVSRRTGLSEADAKARVDTSISRATQLKDEAIASAKTTVEAARKAATRGAFWTAILALFSGVAAMYAAQLGGRHRDENRF